MSERVYNMKKILKLFLTLIFSIGIFQTGLCETITGNVEKSGTKIQNRVIDANSNQGIPFATIKIPTKKFETKSDKDGFFKLNADINGSAIMSVEKDGYRPFSITVDKDNISNPIIIGIEKTQITDLNLETDVIHLGDNNYSEKSANSSEFKLRSAGPYYSKTFKISQVGADENVYFVIGSVIGVDTLLARQMGQSHVTTSYASPAQIYFNGNKIGEIKYNSDNQQILLPKQLIKQNNSNELTIKTGKNLFQKSYIDYDDIEVANLHIEFKPVIARDY